MLDVARRSAVALVIEGMRWMPRLDRFEALRMGMLSDGRRMHPPAGSVDGILAAPTLEALWHGLVSDVEVAGTDPHAFGMDFEAVGGLCDRALRIGCSWTASLHLDDAGHAWTWEVRLVDEVAHGRMPAHRGGTLGFALSRCVSEAEADPLHLAVERAGHQVPDWLSREVERRGKGAPVTGVARDDPRRDDIRRRTIAVKEGMAPDFLRAFAVAACTGPRDAVPHGDGDGSAYLRLTLNGRSVRAGPDSAKRLALDILAALGGPPQPDALPAPGEADPELERLRALHRKATKGHLNLSPTFWGFVGLDAAVDPLDWDGGSTVNGTPHLNVLGEGKDEGLSIDDGKFIVACWNHVCRALRR